MTSSNKTARWTIQSDANLRKRL